MKCPACGYEKPREDTSAARVRAGRLGGRARAESLTPKRRTAIAKKAAAARWARKENQDA